MAYKPSTARDTKSSQSDTAPRSVAPPSATHTRERFELPDLAAVNQRIEDYHKLKSPESVGFG